MGCASQTFCNYRVLIVDDDAYWRSYLRSILETIGVGHIDEAGDGGVALDKIRANGADIVFLDIYMEPLNGLAFLKRVRAGEAKVDRDLKVIVFTQADDDMVMGAALALDCSALMVKSDGINDILQKLNHVILEKQPIKPTIAYRALEPLLEHVFFPVRERRSLPENATVVDVSGLEIGQILAADILLTTGNALLTKGTILSEHLINRLREIGRFSDMMLIAIESAFTEKAPHSTVLEGSEMPDDAASSLLSWSED